MGSFTENDGKPVGSGQFFIAIEPEGFSGGAFARQVTALARSITAQEGARLPNSRREANRKRLKKEGLKLPRDLYEKLVSFMTG
jgi:(2R)-3-sulfolactate dehydrogenase (NADP+)